MIFFFTIWQLNHLILIDAFFVSLFNNLLICTVHKNISLMCSLLLLLLLRCQKFCHILITYLLYSSSYNKNTLAFKGGHYTAPFEAIFLTVVWSYDVTSSCPSKRRTPLLKLPTLVVCWSDTNARSEPWFKTSNNPSELDPDYMLFVASVQFPQVHSEN